MSRTNIIQHAGRNVVLFDFTNLLDPNESMQHIREAVAFVKANLPQDNSALFLTDVIGSRYNAEVLQGLKDLAAHNKPYAAKGAVATNSGLHRVAIMAVATFSGRALKGFPSRAAALDWLVHGTEAAAAA